MEDPKIDSGDSVATEQSTSLVVVDPQSQQVDILSDDVRTPPNFWQRLLYLIRPQSGSVRENLQDALAAHSASDETISPEERAMLHNILRLQGMRVDDVMVPRAEIESVDLKTTLGELLTLFQTSGHSRMPVCSESLDDPRGMVHIRDVVSSIILTAAKKTRRRKAPNGTKPKPKPKPENGMSASALAAIDLSRVDLTKTIEELKLTRDVLFVPPSMHASDLMGRMQTQRIQMALVIDEYGGTDGLVSLEDIVEVVVGNIEDEHDEVEVGIEQASEGVFIMDARVELEDASEFLGNDFVKAVKLEDEDVDTIGGVIFSLLGRVPVRGEVIPSFAGHELEVLDADPRRIRRVKISRSRQLQRKRAQRRDAGSPAASKSNAKTEG
ncbi:MAG: hemolysin family protein [Pseudomonadota bacterium]